MLHLARELLLVITLHYLTQLIKGVLNLALEGVQVVVHQDVKEEFLDDEHLVLSQEITLVLLMQQTLNLGHI